ncbi:hypothetical protein SAMN03159341_11630 [Paenibacillus sp. 1_12]|uniref:hypothetical protein n=1 Tax=Paenibacillus sp. 1_12 TaxID=1566278 RepID=UPI0008E3B768|nr:hypothetical protein [Paenibacillus sp. 1_12]SFM08829.1 hypothetical protein SAMN03159341_11630 [Paenibacillus sp. 1_12]
MNTIFSSVLTEQTIASNLQATDPSWVNELPSTIIESSNIESEQESDNAVSFRVQVYSYMQDKYVWISGGCNWYKAHTDFKGT